MNNNHFESCLMPGLTGLPYIGITDIGISSSGFCDLVRDNLPPRLHHLVVYKRLQNARKDCINPLDTPLGQRYPLPKDREFNKNFLTILVTPPEREKPYEGMSNFVGRMVDLPTGARTTRSSGPARKPTSRGTTMSWILPWRSLASGFFRRPPTGSWSTRCSMPAWCTRQR